MMLVSAGLFALVVFALGIFFYTQLTGADASGLAQDKRAALIRPHSQVFGEPGAKVTIVEFLDPACGTCAQFYPLVKSLVNAGSGRIKLVIRYAPFHPGSDEIVKILEAARMQNVFWPVLEAMLKTQSAWVIQHQAQPALVWDQIKMTGLDVGKARADMNDPGIAQILAQDSADAKTLEVAQTPEYFVNGKPLPEWGWEQLKTLVASEVRSAYGS